MMEFSSHAQLQPAQQRMLERWHDHLRYRGVDVPRPEDFLSFGSISTLERLRTVLSGVDERSASAIRPALRELRSKKWRRVKPTPEISQTRKPRTKAMLSVPEAELPSLWRKRIREMRRLRDVQDQGLLDLDDRQPPATSVIRNLVSTLRQLAKSCANRQLPAAMTKDAVTAWREDCHGRSMKPVSMAARLKELWIFADWCDEDDDMLEHLHRMRGRYLRAATGDMKLKDAWALENPVNIGDVWVRAEDLLAASHGEMAGSAARAQAILDAACLALSVVCPLRCGDLHRIRFGTHLRRHATGWSLRITTSKTETEYDRPSLWPELTPFLDALVMLDTAQADLWRAYDEKSGQPIFSHDFGETEPYVAWPSRCWRRHFGTGEHIVRSLWHSMMFESETDEQWIALALCGQGNGRTAQAYILAGARSRASRRGRAKIREHRMRMPVT